MRVRRCEFACHVDEDGSDDDTHERERLLSVVATPLTARNCRGHPSPERKAAREQDECGTDGHAGHARACQKNAKGERILERTDADGEGGRDEELL